MINPKYHRQKPDKNQEKIDFFLDHLDLFNKK